MARIPRRRICGDGKRHVESYSRAALHAGTLWQTSTMPVLTHWRTMANFSGLVLAPPREDVLTHGLSLVIARSLATSE
jgi:hypothetical protein